MDEPHTQALTVKKPHLCMRLLFSQHHPQSGGSSRKTFTQYKYDKNQSEAGYAARADLK